MKKKSDLWFSGIYIIASVFLYVWLMTSSEEEARIPISFGYITGVMSGASAISFLVVRDRDE